MPYLGRSDEVDNDDENKGGFPWERSSVKGIKMDEDTKSKYPYGTILYIIIMYIYHCKNKIVKITILLVSAVAMIF